MTQPVGGEIIISGSARESLVETINDDLNTALGYFVLPFQYITYNLVKHTAYNSIHYYTAPLLNIDFGNWQTHCRDTTKTARVMSNQSNSAASS